MILNRRRLEGDKKRVGSKIPSGCVKKLQKPAHLLLH
ncbi:hypothetical protein NC652_010786 [Populus alba x Populus x berolinensis]|nr:hypothetical protein NC652_010786 [Populus alba x Populus x berolinensis]